MLSRDIAESWPRPSNVFYAHKIFEIKFWIANPKTFSPFFFFFWWITDWHEENYTVKIPKDPSLKIDHIIYMHLQRIHRIWNFELRKRNAMASFLGKMLRLEALGYEHGSMWHHRAGSPDIVVVPIRSQFVWPTPLKNIFKFIYGWLMVLMELLK